jgi:hypothetical protein
MEELPPIPGLLDSAYLEGPFRTCSSCGSEVREGETPWHIQKTWRGAEVVFELALCTACMEETTRGFSEESMERMQEHFRTHYRPSEDLEVCHLCGTPRTPDTDFEIGAVCLSDRLVRPPVVVCSKCSEEAQENLSDQTRRGWSDFLDRTLPGVPRSMEPDRLPVIF